MKKLFAMILMLALVFSLAACGSTTPEPTPAPSPAPTDGGNDTPAPTTTETFKIGMGTTLGANAAIYGQEAVNGALLAIEYVNANGGFNGAQAELVYYDASTAEDAVKVAQKLIQDDKVNATIESNGSSMAMAAAPYFEEAGILCLPMGNSPAFTQQGWKYVYHAVMNNSFTAEVVEDLVKDYGITKLAIVKSDDDNGLNAAAVFKAACEADGIEIVCEETITSSDTDFSGQCAKVVAADPQTVFISISGDGNGTFTKQLRGFGYNGLLFSKESMTSSMIDVAGEENAKYVIFANPYVTYAEIDDCDIPNVRDFLDRYVAKYGGLNQTEICYRSYDIVMAMWEASKIAGSNDSEALAAAMDKVKFDALGGTADFTSGDHEAFHTFNSFIEINRKNLLFSNWLTNGGLDAYKSETGREF